MLPLFKFNSELIKTDVTSIKICRGLVLCGIGGFLQIFDLNTRKLLLKLQIFEGLRIYGIQISSDESKILFHAENAIKLYRADFALLEFHEYKFHENIDWILAARWIDSDQNVVTVSMHNVIEYWNDEMELIRRLVCEERCILYCAFLCYDNWKDLVVFSGTVFSEVLIWKPAENFEYCPVLKRLIGHKGVLFSIYHNINQPYICSTSDDRAVILWKIQSENLQNELKKTLIEIPLKYKLYGHSARVFGCMITNEHVFSIGEDGILNIWNFNGSIFRKLDAHQNGPVWALDCCENSVVTGGGDSGVTIFPINANVARKVIEFEAKRAILLSNNDLVFITADGAIYHELKLIAKYNELKSYALLEVSICRNLIALGGYNGHIFIYKLINNKLNLICSYLIRTKTRIYSIHWLNCDFLLTCGEMGLIYLWKLQDSKLILLHLMELPVSKERWTTAAAICEKLLVVGDRKGNLHLFNLEHSKPVQTIKKAHNYLGITHLNYIDGVLLSLGRNSILKKFKLNIDQLVEISTDKLPFTWLASLQVANLTKFLIAFSGKDFILYDYNSRRILHQINCGGGHRSWDFNSNQDEFNFAYIKDKNINVETIKWSSIFPRDLIAGLHSSEINDCKTKRIDNEILLITGGEDTTLRLSLYENKSFKTMQILKSHLSSIRCIELFESCLFTGGGRGQIIFWEINENRCNQIYSYYENESSEVRIMDLVSFVSDQHYLLSACSDGKIKIYSVHKDRLQFISFFQYDLRCILKICSFNFSNHTIIVSMATDGFLSFWKFNLHQTNEPIFKLKVQQSGINSYSYYKISDSIYAFLTGGDDNALNLNVLEIGADLEIKLLANHSNASTHCAQITGVYLNRTHFVSASLDQKIVVFGYAYSAGTIDVSFYGVYETTISDIKGIQVFDLGSKLRMVLFGLGIEVLTADTWL